MKTSSTLSSKGQITIPQEVRVRLGLREGDRVEFVSEGPHTIIRPARSPKNPFAEYVGALRTFPEGQEAINSWVREMRVED